MVPVTYTGRIVWSDMRADAASERGVAHGLPVSRAVTLRACLLGRNQPFNMHLNASYSGVLYAQQSHSRGPPSVSVSASHIQEIVRHSVACSKPCSKCPSRSKLEFQCCTCQLSSCHTSHSSTATHMARPKLTRISGSFSGPFTLTSQQKMSCPVPAL